MASNEQPINEPVLVLIGPTAVGKTALSLELARRFSCEIVGLDSMQIYRYMDIGTAKATAHERAQVPHHLIDIVDPDEEYHVARYVEDCLAVCREIIARGHIPLLVGGTGLYLKGLSQGLFEIQTGDAALRSALRERLAREGREALYAELLQVDPESARRIHINDTQRLLRGLEIFRATGRPWSALLREQPQEPLLGNMLKIGLTCERDELYGRINQRVDLMVEEGLLAEVEKLLAMGYSGSLNSMQAIGYRHMVKFIEGAWDWQEALRLLARDTRRYAKRQFTWFNADEGIRWFSPLAQDAVCDAVQRYLARS